MGKVNTQLGQRAYLDANIIIYAVEGFAAYLGQIRALMMAINAGEIVAVTSELTLAEVLVKPLKDQKPALQQAYKTFLAPTPALEVIPISLNVKFKCVIRLFIRVLRFIERIAKKVY